MYSHWNWVQITSFDTKCALLSNCILSQKVCCSQLLQYFCSLSCDTFLGPQKWTLGTTRSRLPKLIQWWPGQKHVIETSVFTGNNKLSHQHPVIVIVISMRYLLHHSRIDLHFGCDTCWIAPQMSVKKPDNYRHYARDGECQMFEKQFTIIHSELYIISLALRACSYIIQFWTWKSWRMVCGI